MILDVIGACLLGLGILLVLLGAVGLLRFPDVFTRSNAATKAAGLGIALVLAGTACVIGTTEAAVKMTIAVVLQFATAPVAGHVIGRAAYRAGAPLWDGTVTDELQGFVERPHEAEIG
ncbi:monovalent cation/H(+) antiporter subunit G [Egicoccus sp. AB-alg6-2]|uniref:monovalent cation/H(+) antiporter subunit G n=1 Tax=Egicoccus sp. AB-alg6-2 TaxID=3242692 RepID=UPI00359E00F9